jgi:hypothetical protein
MTPTQSATIAWLAGNNTGVSSETMAYWLAFNTIPARVGHPHDPDDLDRCLQLLAAVPALREDLGLMAHLSTEWAALVARWDEIAFTHREEVGLGWTKARSAPRTYELMRSILDKVDRAKAWARPCSTRGGLPA